MYLSIHVNYFEAILISQKKENEWPKRFSGVGIISVMKEMIIKLPPYCRQNDQRQMIIDGIAPRD